MKKLLIFAAISLCYAQTIIVKAPFGPANPSANVNGTSVTITHNLNTTNVLVSCENSSGAPLAYSSTTRTVNTVTVTFSGSVTGKCYVNGTGGVGPQGSQGPAGQDGGALGYTAENTANKGQANGYASLDGSGKVPTAQIPSLNYQAPLGYTAENTANKGANNGYAGLNGSGKVPVTNLPVMVGDSGSGGTAGLVPAPGAGDAANCLKGNGTYGACAALGYTAENTANKGAANGYAPLDLNAKLPAANLPNTIDTGDGSAAGEVNLFPPSDATNSVGFIAPATRSTPLKLELPSADPANSVMIHAAPSSNKSAGSFKTLAGTGAKIPTMAGTPVQGNALTVDSSGAIVDSGSALGGGPGGSGAPNYEKSFLSSDSTVTITNAQHGCGTSKMVLMARYTDVSPSEVIGPMVATIDESTYQVTWTNSGARAGKLVVNCSGSGATFSTDPVACTSGQYVTDVAADGTLTCSTPPGSGSPIFINVKDYGVKGDGVTLTNVTTTSGSATVTRASGSWVSADIGKRFSCLGAGASGTNLNTTISAVAGSSATLAATAGTTISGTATCTYATDDTAAISTVATANRPGVLFFPKGIYGINGGVPWFSQLSAIGAGVGKTVWMAMYSGDMTAAMINGTGSAGTPFTDNEIAGIEFDGKYANQSTYNIAGKAIAVIHMLRAKIHDNYAHDFPATCIGPDELADSMIYNNRVHNCGLKNDGTQGGGNGIGFSLLDDTHEGGTISGNICSNAKRYCIMLEAGAGVNRTARWNITGNECHIDSGFGGPTGTGCILDGGTNGTLIGTNRLYGPTDTANVWGVVVNRSSTGTTPGINTHITDNFITGFDSCISIDHTTTAPSSSPHNYKVDGNKCDGPRSAGIQVVSHSTTPMVGIELNNNRVTKAGNAGIEFSGAAGIQGLVTTNNTLIGNGQTTANTWEAAGIASNANVTKWIAHGNTAYDDGSGKQLYGMSANAKTLSNIDWRNNPLSGNVTSQLFLSGSTVTGVNLGNLGPSGNAAYPATTADAGAVRSAGTPACFDGAGNITGDSGVCGSFAAPTNSWSWVGPSSTLDAGTTGTTETAHNVSFTIPANTMAVGTTYRLTTFFQDVSPASQSSRNPKLYLKKSGAGGFGSTVYASAATSPTASTTRGVGIDIYIRCLTTGTTGTVEVWDSAGTQYTNNAGLNTIAQPITVDTTADMILQWTQTFGSANAGNTNTLRRMGLVQLP